MRFKQLLLVIWLLLSSCQREKSDQNIFQTEIETRKDGFLEFASQDGKTLAGIDIEIADTDSKRTVGLMRRRSLDYNQGMLFIFDQPDTLRFWMKDTPMPLDIFFIASDSTVINIAERTVPLSQSNYTSSGPARFVVETRGGFADHFGIGAGTRVRWTKTAALAGN